VKLVVDEVNRIQHLIDSEGFSDQLYMQDLEAQLLLTKALNFQEQLWKEKARDQNFVNGDRNTAYFHRVFKIRAATKSISFLQDGDNVITDPTEIEMHVLSYFQAIFSMDNNCALNTLVDETIPSLVTDADTHMLMRLPLSSEIKDVVFSLNGDGAPGPDGFGGHFYQTFWDIVGVNVVNSMQDFFLDGRLPSSITSQIISIEQRGFVRDCNISDCVILASEAINSLDKKQYGGNIALKVDISKAFDTLDWNFLVMVLRNFGFSPISINWIVEILKSALLSVLVNGKAIGVTPYFLI